MASREASYKVTAWDWDEFFAELEQCPDAQQVRVSEFLAQVLPFSPKATHPPLLKKLHGAQSHLFQFECGKSRRLHYEVIDTLMEVRIVYFGMHPPWEKRGKVGG